MNWTKIDTLGKGRAMGPSLVAGGDNLVGLIDGGGKCPAAVYRLPGGSNKHKLVGIKDKGATESASDAIVLPPHVIWTTEENGAIYQQTGDSFKCVWPRQKTKWSSMGIDSDEANWDCYACSFEQKKNRSIILKRDKATGMFTKIKDLSNFTAMGLSWAGTLGWFVYGSDGKYQYFRWHDKDWNVIETYPSDREGYYWHGADWIDGEFYVTSRHDATLWHWTINGLSRVFRWTTASRIDRIIHYGVDRVYYPLDNGELWKSTRDMRGFALEKTWPGWEVRAMGKRAGADSLLVYINKEDNSKCECWEGK